MKYLEIGFAILIISAIAILILRLLFLFVRHLISKTQMIKLLDDQTKAILLYDSLELIAIVYDDHITWIKKLSSVSKRRVKEIERIQANYAKEYELIKEDIRINRLSQTDFLT